MQEYSPNIYYEIFDNNGFLGALVDACDGEFKPYTGEIYDDATFFLKRMLYQYNKEIASKKDSIPREIYALRILERRGLNPDKGLLVPVKSALTAKMVSRYKDDYELSQSFDHSYKLTLDQIESRRFAKDCELKVLINFDESLIVFDKFTRFFDMADYCTTMEVGPLDYKDTLNKLEYYPNIDEDYTLTKFTFNHMDDVTDIVKNNTKGFRDTRSDRIIAIK